MTLGAYRETAAFSYPGWRLTVPGGPAGGHNKGFTHTESAGTTILPQDQYEVDRGEGMSSHDTVHTHEHSPRGVYRSSGEVPPRPNASGAAHTYRGYQTQRHAGTSVAPGSYPADFFETGEDSFLDLAENAVHYLKPEDAMGILGAVQPFTPLLRPNVAGCSEMIQYVPPGYRRVQTGTDGSGCPIYSLQPVADCQSEQAAPPDGMQWVQTGVDSNGCPTYTLKPLVGATSFVPIPPIITGCPAWGCEGPTPAPRIPVYTAPPVSPTPGPIVATNEVVPLNDGSGNYINLSTGQIIPASAVSQNLATMQLTASPTAAGVLSWMEQPSSFFPSIPNWGLLAGAAVAAAMLLGKHR